MSSKRPSDASTPPGVVIDHAADVLTFTLDNPGHGNEVTGAMLDDMLIELRKEATNPRARLLRIRARGNVPGGIYPFIHQPAALITIGFLLTIPIYILVATLFAIYIPELFPTEVRLRASGICNTFGRGATILTPFLTVALFRSYGIRPQSDDRFSLWTDHGRPALWN
jgi:hypothetical protein